MNVKLIATTAMGLESIAAQEVRDLGYKVEVENGKVIFEGDSSAIARSNLWLRVADRVKLVVGEFKAYTFDELFEKTKDLPWEKYIDENGQFPVSGKSHKSKLFRSEEHTSELQSYTTLFRSENGIVIFEGDSSAIARSNLWLRVADRVKLVVGEFKAYTFDELFEKTKDLPWEKYIDENGQFPVSGKSHKSKLFSVRDCQAIVKKSI